MPTKSEIEDDLNKRLRTDYEWSKMKKEDLIEFRERLKDEEFLKTVVGAYASEYTGEKVQEQIEGWEPGMIAGMIAGKSAGQDPGDEFDF